MTQTRFSIRDIFNHGLAYQPYRDIVNQLVREGKTTGLDQTVEKIEFTKLNIQRMNRLDKTLILSSLVPSQLNTKATKWLVIGDAWCGDCAQIIPVLYKLSVLLENVELRIISRDNYPGFVELYNENGTKSIPVLLLMNDQFSVQKRWGPRPELARQILLHYKANMDTMTKDDFEKELHLWYAKDKGQHIAKEVIGLLG